MSRYRRDEFESDADETPLRPGELSVNGQWLFGAAFAGLILIGFAFGVWAGVSKTKTVEVAKDNTEKPHAAQQSQTPTPPKAKEPEPKVKEPEQSQPKEPEPKQPTEPEPKAKEPEPKVKEPEPKAKEPEPKAKEPEPKAKSPEPKTPAAKQVAFKDVRPILMTYCGNCHGNAGKPKGGVDLRTVASIRKGGDDGDVVKGTDPMKSPLYESITAGRMPPDGKPAPNPDELKLIHDWIASGAKERRRPIRGRNGARAKLRRAASSN